MTQVLTAVAGTISLIGATLYIMDIVRGKTKPRVTSWIVWAVLTGIATTASYADGQLPATILGLCMTFSCVVIAVLGIITNGILSFERFDIGCLIFAGGGLGLWYIFNSPAIAIVAVIIIDVIAGLPTLRHVWKTPQEETLVEFLMAGAASCLTVLAATSMEITAIAYPLYILIFDGTIATIIILRRRRTIAYNQKYEDITNFCRNNE